MFHGKSLCLHRGRNKTNESKLSEAKAVEKGKRDEEMFNRGKSHKKHIICLEDEERGKE